MNVLPGYKQTEMGVVPEDWNESTLLSLADGTKERFDDGDWIEAEFLAEAGVRLIQTGNIGIGSFVDKEAKKFISDRSFDLLRCKALASDDLLICRLAEPAGRACLLPKLDSARAITAVDVTIFRPVETRADRKFLLQLFCTRSWFSVVSERCGGTTRTRIARGALGKLAVPLPPTLAEQQAIAQALSDADALIESLEQLIAKKRQLKQGAMQELLRPQVGWQTQSIGSLFHLSTGSAKSNKLSSAGRLVVMDMGSVSSDGRTISAKRTDVEEDLLTLGDLVMPKDDIGGGQIIGKVAYIDRDKWYVLGDHVYRLARIDSRVETLFFYFLINSQYVNKDLKKKVAGSAQLMLGRSSVLDHPVTFPGDPAEQNAIATILFDMDAELVMLDAKLAKARQLKQGMMQALLTGRIRLPIEEAA